MTERPWLVRRQVGIGWRPVAWEGWSITILAVVAVISGIVTIRVAKSPIGVIPLALGVVGYVATIRFAGPSAAVADDDSRHAQLSPVTTVPVQPAPSAPHAARAERDQGIAHSPARGAALIAEGLTKRFGDRVAFQDVSFEVGAGEVFGFLGPNGAGKTTTVRTLGALIEPTSGTAVVAGIPLNRNNGEAIRDRIAIMPEAPGLYLRLSVRENLEYFAGLFSVRDPRVRISEALQAVNLESRANDLCGSLSKGLRQRVGLARALLSDPEVLFLDEPTSGLDPVATREVHELIGNLRRKGVTVFLTTHRLEEAERLCDRVAILNTTLRMVGRPDELRAQLFSRSLMVTTRMPLSAPEHVFSRVTGVERWVQDISGRYVVTVADPKAVAPELIRALVTAGADVQSIAESQHTLEDVYLELISDDVEARPR